MAGALAPVVWLMILASLLFGAAGVLDGIYPGGPNFSLQAYGGVGWTSYVLGLVNLFVAVFIARGSERSLVVRIGLAALFVVERTTTAFFPVQKSTPSIGVHLTTAVIEAVILNATWRVWRLGRTATAVDMASLALATAGGPAAVAAPAPAVGSATDPPPSRPRGSMALRTAPRIPPGATRAIALLAFILAGSFVADALLLGIVPGVTGEVSAADWLVYLYAVIVLVVAAVAVGGRRLPLRLLLVVSVILFLERAFTPFLPVGQAQGTTSLALHVLSAVIALLLAAVCAAALRSTRLRHAPPLPPT